MNIETLHQLFLKSSGVSIDTRSIKQDAIFFALKGDNFNGNTYASKAIDEGALYSIIDEKKYHLSNNKTYLVSNVLETLQALAKFHRTYLGLPIIALTGSNGKTTTKELILSVLSQQYNTNATKGNLNNHIGVPLTLLSMNKNTEIGVVEMGANHLGEIAMLCEITQPDFGYITNFGKAHLEGFGSLQGVINAKTELYNHLQKNNKKAFVNSDDKIQADYSANIDLFSFGIYNADCLYKIIASNPKVKIEFNNLKILSNLIGKYNATNIAAALCIGTFFNVTSDKLTKGIENYIPANNRSQIIQKQSNSIVLDAYNANPTSMIAALESFISTVASNKILFLGDMFELGTEAKKEHQNIVDYLQNNFFGKIYLIGLNFYSTNIVSEKIKQYKKFEDLELFLKNTEIEKASILIKGSRGMALERILEFI